MTCLRNINMSMLYTFKPMKDRVLQPVSRLLLAAGVTPNMVTACGLLLSAAAGVVALTGHLYVGIALFLAGACLDAFDGSFARACGLTSEFGRYFDSFSDRCSELAVRRRRSRRRRTCIRLRRSRRLVRPAGVPGLQPPERPELGCGHVRPARAAVYPDPGPAGSGAV